MASSVGNASMMSVKLEDWKTALSQATFARTWTDPDKQKDKYEKLSYRMAKSNNGLGKHDEALLLLKSIS